MAHDAAGMRASDAERDRVMSQLSRHFQDGRLDTSEFNERLEAASAARTRGDLSALLTDLPTEGEPWAATGSTPAMSPTASTASTAPAMPQQAEPARWMPVAAGVFAVAIISGVIATAVGGRHGYWFPWWIIPVTFLIIRRAISRRSTP